MENGLKSIPLLFLMLAIAAIIGGSAATTLGSFGDNIADKCFNATWSYNAAANVCRNNTFIGNLTAAGYAALPEKNFSNAFLIVDRGGDSLTDVGEQLSTLAIIGVMTVIIGLLVGVYSYMTYFK